MQPETKRGSCCIYLLPVWYSLLLQQHQQLPARCLCSVCERRESSEGFRVDRMTVRPSTQLNLRRTVTKTLTDIMKTQEASKPLHWGLYWWCLLAHCGDFFYLTLSGTGIYIRVKCPPPCLWPINRLLTPEKCNVIAGESRSYTLWQWPFAHWVNCRLHKGDSYPHKC